VTFEGFFRGQRAVEDNITVGIFTTATGNPSGPLALSATAPDTFAVFNNPDFLLTGTPRAKGPIAFLFSKPVSAFGVSSDLLPNLHSSDTL
jgi:hypothetical protein